MTNDFGQWLRRQLDRRELSMTAFAEKIGVSHSSVSLWLDGKRTPNPKSCDRIADVLVVDVDHVLALAGHRPKTIEVDPDSPTARIMEYVERIDWSEPGRIEGLIAQLETYLKIDEMRKQQS